MTRSLPQLNPAARAEVEKLISPESLAVVSTVLGAWAVSRFRGVGEIVDIVISAAGASATGMAVFDGVEELFSFAMLALKPQSDTDLDRSAAHFSEAVIILGARPVRAVLLRSVSWAGRGRRLNPAPPPQAVNGAVSPEPPRTTRHRTGGLGPGSLWGKIVVSRYGIREDRRQAALHERVSKILAPKVDLLRAVRIANRAPEKERSPLSMYLEEALVEAAAQVGAYGMRSVFSGLSFPVRNGYVTLLRKEGVNQREVHPAIPELAGEVAGSFKLGGEAFEIRFSARRLPANRDPIAWGS